MRDAWRRDPSLTRRVTNLLGAWAHKKHQRSIVLLLTAWSFVVLAVTGILALVRPFPIGIVGLHALMRFVFVGLIALHVANNLNRLSQYVRSKVLWLTLPEAGRE